MVRVADGVGVGVGTGVASGLGRARAWASGVGSAVALGRGLRAGLSGRSGVVGRRLSVASGGGLGRGLGAGLGVGSPRAWAAAAVGRGLAGVVAGWCLMPPPAAQRRARKQQRQGAGQRIATDRTATGTSGPRAPRSWCPRGSAASSVRTGRAQRSYACSPASVADRSASRTRRCCCVDRIRASFAGPSRERRRHGAAPARASCR